MKKISLILLLFSTVLIAQNDKNDKIKAFKTAFITERLDLSSKEAEKFWPIYNAYENEISSIRQSERREIRMLMVDGFENMSDDDANSIIEKLLNLKSEELKLQKDLVQNLKAVISSKKILKLKRAEEDFKKKLLERLKNRRGN